MLSTPRKTVCASNATPNPPSSGRPKGRFAPFGPPLMSNVRPLKGTSMRAISCLLAAVVCISCATSDYQPYEGKGNLYEGKGGTKVVVDGVDFWANGEP